MKGIMEKETAVVTPLSWGQALSCHAMIPICRMREPPVKKVLYWCPRCNIPLLGRSCMCGAEGRAIPLLRPYDARPALKADRDLLAWLLDERYGTDTLPRVIVLNKTGGIDRKDLVIANGGRFGWLSYDPAQQRFDLELTFESLPFILPSARRNVLELAQLQGAARDVESGRRIGGKRYPAEGKVPDGGVLVRWNGHGGVGVRTVGMVKVKEVGRVSPGEYPDPGWDEVISRNRLHLKNLERNAIRFIRQQAEGHECVNISFSGGKDSTAALELARRAGFEDSYFVDTGMEFPETLGFVKSLGIRTILRARNFWREVERRGPPRKDDRWCCELQKLAPVKEWLEGKGECITIQGNRWYESFARAGLPAAARNPFHPMQINVSPIRNWRALEVFLYIWWRNLPQNPLYEMGMERVGCWMCPAMLESEFAVVRTLHPDLHRVWMEFLGEWFRDRGLDKEALSAGAWRWKQLPPKMRGWDRD